MGGVSMNAQTEHGFKEIDVTKEFDNPFMFFNKPLLLMAGDTTGHNAMTIGWGAVGNIWGMKRNVMTVYVAEKRYTLEFMEKAKYFTVMKIDGKVRPIWVNTQDEMVIKQRHLVCTLLTRKMVPLIILRQRRYMNVR